MAALMAESPAEAWVTVFCQRTYNPYQAYGRRNPAFRAALALMAACSTFKQRDARAIKSETAVLLDAVKQFDFDDAILVIIPGHEAAASNDGTTFGLCGGNDSLGHWLHRSIRQPDQDHVDREAREGWESEHRGAPEFDGTL